MDDTRVIAAAEAMRIKRSDLQAQPLDRIWRELAAAGIAAADKAEMAEAFERHTKTVVPYRFSLKP